jgi:hypothetical protein
MQPVEAVGLMLFGLADQGGGSFEVAIPDEQVAAVVETLEQIAFGAQEEAGCGTMTIVRLPGRPGRTRVVVRL